MKNMIPRTKDKDVRIAEIQSAAMEVFCSKGYQNATMREIAKRANVSKGTLYLYYKSKEDLYVGLVVPFLKDLGSSSQRLLEELNAGKYQSGPQFIEALCEMIVDVHTHNREGFQIYQASQIGNLFVMLSEETATALTTRGKKNYRIMRNLLQGAINRGLIQDVDVVKTIDVVLGIFAGVVQYTENKRRWTKKDHTDSTLRYAFSLLYSGLCGHAGELP